MKLRRISFILVVLGVAILLFLLVWQSYYEVKSFDDLDNLEVNTKVVLNGRVESLRDFDGFIVGNGCTVIYLRD